MRLRQMAVAFLINQNDEVLLLQKPSSHAFLPGKLVPIGGHMEPEEINDPERTIIREVKEETGLILDKLQLKYIVHRLKADENEVRVQYVFFAKLKEDVAFISSNEGELCWIRMKDIEKENVSETSRAIASHYNEHPENEKIYTGTMKSDNGKATMTWSVLEDWLKGKDCIHD
ncbi:NUDIX domain-containing protein [Cytobacillus sp. FSL K6-0265]|uniref:NUDIX domain-containing protein n=1 Tax=Cytobacillus sp. FSL K6-0265 TaxID=2921448 RepID=UPI0030F53B57